MIQPKQVHDVLRRHLLVDGYELVLDVAASRGSSLVDARDGTTYLDMFSFFASNALGMNHPPLTEDAELRETLATVALNKPTNSAVYTTHMAHFVATFERVLGDPHLPHLFLIEGGAAAVENALKVAFDWKSRRNEEAGRSPDLGTKVLHLTRAFHGRSGYTLSLTNSAPVKTARYPKFAWPRIDVPAVKFPVEHHLEEVELGETRALRQAHDAFDAAPHDIACFIAEPIQGEGGDNHMRAGFLRAMQQLCVERDALFVLDEVQTGCGLTGTAWAYEQLGLEPDIVVFGKKLQVCGAMAGRRVDDVRDNVFRVSGRINSTWGGNLVDMVRASRMLEIIHADRVVDGVPALGASLLDELALLEERFPRLVSNVRGRGLMCALDLPDTPTRERVVERLITEEHVIMLGCGERSLRFRPVLTVTHDQLRAGVDALARVLARETQAIH